MNTTALLIILLVVAMVVLASLPFVHRWWTSREGYSERKSLPPPTAPPTQPPTQPADPATSEPLTEPPAESTAEPTERAGTIRTGLSKARASLGNALSVIGRRGVDESTWSQLTDALVLADVGIATATQTVDQLRSTEQRITEGSDLLAALSRQMNDTLRSQDRSLRLEVDSQHTPVWLFVGVNGVGKTTTIGKVGHRLNRDQGLRAVFAAADTFRAAATEQLTTWAQRCDGYLVSGSAGADPGSVIHDSVGAATARDYDIVLADTAGRLQNKANLMSELAKVRRVADKPPGQVAEVLLVIDATTGQNGLSQAQSFAEAAAVTGIVLTKLDGSAKGGIVFAIEAQLGLPVKLVGVGEGIDDLVDFEPDAFVEALLAEALD